MLILFTFTGVIPVNLVFWSGQSRFIAHGVATLHAIVLHQLYRSLKAPGIWQPYGTAKFRVLVLFVGHSCN